MMDLIMVGVGVGGFVLGFALAKWGDNKKLPPDENHVSRECLDWIILEDGKR